MNCNTALVGRFCQNCGQENIEPRPSFWTLVLHFFADITHFDGKLFETIGLLASRPGFLPAEYIRGRRARYLDPIRMYVFTSAVFFLVSYSLVPHWTEREMKEVQKSWDVNVSKADTAGESILDKNYPTVAAYDSVQNLLTAEKRDGWFSRLVNHRMIALNAKYSNDAELTNAIVGAFVHSMPYLLFISLPLYAVFLLLLYYRKKFIYTDHTIFLIYLYIFTFLVLLAYIGLSYIDHIKYLGWLRYIEYLLLTGGVVYAVVAMKRFYGGSKKATILKFIVFNIFAFVSLIFLFFLFLILTLIRS